MPSLTFLINACVTLAYALSILTSALRVYVIFAQTKTESAEKMLIKVWHQEKGYGSKKLLAEFPNKAFELILTVFTVLETGVFSVSPKRLKNLTT